MIYYRVALCSPADDNGDDDDDDDNNHRFVERVFGRRVIDHLARARLVNGMQIFRARDAAAKTIL